MEKPKRRKFRQETVIHSYIVRPLAQELVLLIWHTNISPNQLTLIRSIVSIIYLYLFTLGSNQGFIIGIVLFQIAEVMDHADGMLARMKNQTSRLGQYYEYVTDQLFAAEHGLLGLVVAYGAYTYTANVVYLYLAVLVMFFYYFAQYIKISVNAEQLVSQMEFNHDGDAMIKILGVPFNEFIKNSFKTVYQWRNQLFFVSLIYLIYCGELLLLATFIIFAILNFLRMVKQLKDGYLNNKA